MAHKTKLLNFPMDPDEAVSGYWRARASQSVHDTYRGLPLAKMPEDLRTYQHIIWDTSPEVIVELGTFAGGSALWFLDQLKALSTGDSPQVITIDVDGVDIVELGTPGITHIMGDLRNPAMIALVKDMMRADARTMVVEDSAHTYGVTKAALEGYSEFVTPGCYFVVEDGIVEEQDVCPPGWYDPGSVKKAIDGFMDGNEDFVQHSYAPYGLTMHHGGWLERR